MTTYSAPLRDMQFAMKDLADLDGVIELPGYAEATPDLVDAVLEEAAKLASEVLSPLNKPGDANGARLGDSGVCAADGFAADRKSVV